MREPTAEAVVDRIVEFFQGQRSRIREEGLAESRTVQGKDPDNYFEREAGDGKIRRYIAKNTDLSIEKDLSEDFALVVKDVVIIAALLPVLAERFKVYGMVRNPLAVLGSWNSVQFNMRMGRSPHAEWFDPDLGRALASTHDRFDRQLVLLAWWFERLSGCLPANQILRYEDVIDNVGTSLAVMVPAAVDLDSPLRSHNTNAAYDIELMEDCAKRLLNSDGAYWDSYEPADVEELLAEMRKASVD